MRSIRPPIIVLWWRVFQVFLWVRVGAASSPGDPAVGELPGRAARPKLPASRRQDRRIWNQRIRRSRPPRPRPTRCWSRPRAATWSRAGTGPRWRWSISRAGWSCRPARSNASSMPARRSSRCRPWPLVESGAAEAFGLRRRRARPGLRQPQRRAAPRRDRGGLAGAHRLHADDLECGAAPALPRGPPCGPCCERRRRRATCTTTARASTPASSAWRATSGHPTAGYIRYEPPGAAAHPGLAREHDRPRLSDGAARRSTAAASR